MSTYVIDQAWMGEKARLDALSALHDPHTIQALETIPIKEDWRCAEVGAGAGSIALWLAERVGDSGRVVATDIDTRFLDVLDHPALDVRGHDIVAGPLEEGAYDLVHARLLLMHVADRGKAVQHMLKSVRPGGWLLLEDADFRNYQVSYPPSESLRTTGEAMVRLMESIGADPQYGPKLYSILSAMGLQNLRLAGQQVIVACGTPRIAALTLFLIHLRDRLISQGLTTDDAITAALDELETPSSNVVYGPILVSVWGQRKTLASRR